jgi:hypothetical protein
MLILFFELINPHCKCSANFKKLYSAAPPSEALMNCIEECHKNHYNLYSKCSERINLDSQNNLEETWNILEANVQALTQLIINLRNNPPTGYIELKWKSTMNVNKHHSWDNKANNSSSLMTELMMQLYTLGVVANKRGCAAMCHAIGNPDKINQIAALKLGFKFFKHAAEVFAFINDNCYKVPHFKVPVDECPELHNSVSACYATMNAAMSLMCATGTSILETKDPAFIARLARNTA